jgi:murein L,D-transpeptidase YafK
MCTGIIAFLALFMTSFPVTSTSQSIPEKVKIDSIVVWKSKRIMLVYSGNKLIKSYDIALGKNPVGKKEFEGDFKTPEGLYYIDAKSARSKYHKNLNISYPSKDDKEHAKKCGKKCGGEIKIHGLPNRFNEKEYLRTDWTWGCIAVTNSEIEELYEHTALGSPILLLP